MDFFLAGVEAVAEALEETVSASEEEEEDWPGLGKRKKKLLFSHVHH